MIVIPALPFLGASSVGWATLAIVHASGAVSSGTPFYQSLLIVVAPAVVTYALGRGGVAYGQRHRAKKADLKKKAEGRAQDVSDAHDEDTSDLQSSITTLHDQVTDLKRSLSEMRDRNERLSDRNNDLNDRNDRLNTQLITLMHETGRVLDE